MKRILISLLAGVLLTACGSNESVIEGTVTGLPDGTVYLVRKDADPIRIDSASVQNGAFRFALHATYIEPLYLQFDGAKGEYMFLYEPGTIVVDANFDADPEVKASSPSNDLLAEYNAVVKPYDDQMNAVYAAFGDLGPNDFEAMDSLRALYGELSDQKTAVEDSFIHSHPGQPVSAYLLSRKLTYGYTPQQMDSLIALGGANMPENYYSDRLATRRAILEKVAVGQPAPDFTLATPDGTPFSFSMLKGNVVLIDFWASWCGPCRRENPNVVKLYEKYKDQGFTIIGVSLDESKEDWIRAIQEDGLVWTQVSDLKGWQSPAGKEYGVIAIPHTVLVGKDGKILANVVFGEELEALVAQAVSVE